MMPSSLQEVCGLVCAALMMGISALPANAYGTPLETDGNTPHATNPKIKVTKTITSSCVVVTTRAEGFGIGNAETTLRAPAPAVPPAVVAPPTPEFAVQQGETRTLPNFTAIEASGALCLIEVTCQQQPSISFVGFSSTRGVDVDIDDGVLTLSGAARGNNLVIKIGVPTLESIELTGAQMVKIAKLSTQEFNVDMSGACQLELSGKVKKLWLGISGASFVNAKELQSDVVVVESCGASKADVHVVREICASASGVSKISYSGKPSTVRKEASGLAIIKSKD